MTQDEAYKLIGELAREHALVWNAVGGVITIVHPDTQKETGIYEHCQFISNKRSIGDYEEYTRKRMNEAENHGMCDKYY